MRGSTAKRITTTMMNTEATADNRTASVAEQGAHVAPEKTTSKKAASQKKGAPKANRGVKKAASKKAARPAASMRATKKPATSIRKKTPQLVTEAREGSKKATILELLRRPKGATITEIGKATNWKSHSIRGFISGTLRKAMGLTVESSKNQSGERTYRTAK